MSHRSYSLRPFVWLLLLSLAFFAAIWPVLGQQDPETPLQKAIDRADAGLHRKTRIAGGRDASIADNPWQVALVGISPVFQSNADAQFCGGSIVASRWVLTAAHCVDAPTKDSEVAILVGTASLLSGGRRISLVVGGIHIHKQYDYLTNNNDIALLETSQDLPGTPIAGWLASDPENDGQDVRITGWGALSWQKSPPMSAVLQAADPDPKIINRNLCNEVDSHNNRVLSTMICIGNWYSGQQDSCDRDSGGPATSLVGGKRKLIGITSFGAQHCATPKKPGVYTRVSQFAKWVHDTSGNAINWTPAS
jgi:secreted trypsin-like serine protease